MLKPLADKILIKRVKNDEKTPGGIIVPDTAKDKPMEGTVVAVGPGRWEDGVRQPMHVKINDRVVFGSWSGKEIKIDNEEYVVMTEVDIIGIIS